MKVTPGNSGDEVLCSNRCQSILDNSAVFQELWNGILIILKLVLGHGFVLNAVVMCFLSAHFKESVRNF